MREIANDYLWVFAGGTPPNDFLKKVGVEFGHRDLTRERSDEAKLACVTRRGPPAQDPRTCSVRYLIG